MRRLPFYFYTVLLPLVSVVAALPACAAQANAAARAPLLYPIAKQVAQSDTYFATQVNDPYRWLENLDAADTRAWIDAENKLTTSFIAPLPGREHLRKRLAQLWNFERYSPPRVYAGKYFFTHNDGLQNQDVLLVAETAGATPRVLLDPNTLNADGTQSLQGWSVSQDAAHVAYGISAAGSDWEEWRVLDVATGKPLRDILKWVKFSNVSWRRDGSGFFYSRYEEPSRDALKATNKYQKLYFHRLGEDQQDDTLIYEDAAQPEWRFTGRVSDDGRWLVITVSRSTEQKNLVLYRDLSKKREERQPKAAHAPTAQPPGPRIGGKRGSKPPKTHTLTPIETLVGTWDASYEYVGNAKNMLYFLTDLDAPRHRVIGIDVNNPDPGHWKVILPEAADTLQSVHCVNRKFIAVYMHDAHSDVRVFDEKGRNLATLALPGFGTAAGFTGSTFDAETFYTYSSFTAPPTVFRYDLQLYSGAVLHAPQLPFDSSAFETHQVFYSSRDGTRIPMFITAKKGISSNGANPTILYGYGGFNIAQQPSFSPSVATWLDQGYVYAVANLRGGGEYGREWHEAGIKTHKQNVFDDFIGAAEYLIKEKITSPQKLAIRGASNGGLLVAAVELQRPELFAAAVPQVGVLDMLRFRDFTIGKAWESDFGSVENHEEFNALLAYSPLQNIKESAAYPATLIVTGDHDDRVFPAHSFKFAAALQASDPRGKPILIRIETRAGHGKGKPTSVQIDEAADIYAFILAAFGMP